MSPEEKDGAPDQEHPVPEISRRQAADTPQEDTAVDPRMCGFCRRERGTADPEFQVASHVLTDADTGERVFIRGGPMYACVGCGYFVTNRLWRALEDRVMQRARGLSRARARLARRDARVWFAKLDEHLLDGGGRS